MILESLADQLEIVVAETAEIGAQDVGAERPARRSNAELVVVASCIVISLSSLSGPVDPPCFGSPVARVREIRNTVSLRPARRLLPGHVGPDVQSCPDA